MPIELELELESRDVYFMSGNIQRKYNKRNSQIEVSDETILKPKIRKGIK